MSPRSNVVGCQVMGMSMNLAKKHPQNKVGKKLEQKEKSSNAVALKAPPSILDLEAGT
jgi:hypothetical protein